MSTHDAGRQVEAVLDVLTPKIDAGELGFASQRWPIFRFDYEGQAVMPADDQLRSLAERIVTAVRTSAAGAAWSTLAFPAPVQGSASACLRTFDGDGTETSTRCLHGLPKSLGVTAGEHGQRRAAVLLAVTADGAAAVDTASREWLDAAIQALQTARDELVYGVRVTPGKASGRAV